MMIFLGYMLFYNYGRRVPTDCMGYVAALAGLIEMAMYIPFILYAVR